METTPRTPTPADVQQAVAELHPVFLILIRTLVDKPDEVDITVTTTSDEVVFKVHVDPFDIGKVIGKNGRNAKSLRTLLSAASMKYDVRLELDIPAPDHPGAYTTARESFNPGPRTSH